ncbi:hypothetical protein NPIL_344821 [Nephila pilipes]|uniref:Uncharacterized protein n=1 Tax=Nephila pilipes TaxID=299642 RepID=A0A8X6T5Y7_NEPPI|nr:hypothetical protein NPIL_344821 [Nephila pilipes]
MGQTVEASNDSNAMFLMYDFEDPDTFIHYSGSSTYPDLTMITTNVVDQCIKTVIGDPGSGHRITKLIVELKAKLKRDIRKIKRNFKKAKWRNFTDLMENLVKEKPNNHIHYQETTAFSGALKRNTKQNILKGTNV